MLQHSMLYFFHHYELPVILQQAQLQQLLLRNQHQQQAAAAAAAAAASASSAAPQQVPEVPLQRSSPEVASGTLDPSPSSGNEESPVPLASADAATSAVGDVFTVVDEPGPSSHSSAHDAAPAGLAVVGSVSADGGGEASPTPSSGVEGNVDTTLTKFNDDSDVVKISGDSVPVAEQEGKEVKVTPVTSLDTQ
jgi:hypothetical protein